MAQAGILLDEETFYCAICLGLLKKPVTIPCGHSYCMNCIKDLWNAEEEKRSYSCPLCRQIFTPRPNLVKNTVLTAAVEELKEKRPTAHCYAGPKDVSCDVCSGRKLKASKSCLFCLVSFCEKHLKPHIDSPAYKYHKLVEPSKNLQESICSRHCEVMKIFCRRDQQCICYNCSLDEHKGHDIVSTASERTERQRELEVSIQNIQQRIQEREPDLKVLQGEIDAINSTVDKAVQESDKVFSLLTHLVKKRHSEVNQQLWSQQKAEVSRVKELQKDLEEEITELRRRHDELKKLSATEDHIQFLHNSTSLSELSQPRDSSSINISPQRWCVTEAISEFRDKVQDVLKQEWPNMLLRVNEEDLFLSEPEPKTRADFLKYSRTVTLDPNTVNMCLSLSEMNRRVTFMRKNHSYSSHPDRVTEYFQVLSRESLSGRCYWEVKWTGIGAYVAVTYKSTSREQCRKEYGLGYNDKSWALDCSKDRFSFMYNGVRTYVSHPLSSRIGVYLDHSAGILCFYSVSETMPLLHRVQTTFTQPLYAGLQLYYYGDSAEICKLR